MLEMCTESIRFQGFSCGIFYEIQRLDIFRFEIKI